jgi:hypothetical protein
MTIPHRARKRVVADAHPTVRGFPTITFRVTKEQHKRVKMFCIENEISIQDMCNDAVNRFMEDGNAKSRGRPSAA